MCTFILDHINTLSPRQNGCHFADDSFKCIFLKENACISIKISLKFVPNGPINNISALVQIMAWCRPGDKPLSEPMMVRLPTHICVTRPQWVNWLWTNDAVWQHRFGLTLARVIVWCLTALSHHPNRCRDLKFRLIAERAQDIIQFNELENKILITDTFPKNCSYSWLSYFVYITK